MRANRKFLLEGRWKRFPAAAFDGVGYLFFRPGREKPIDLSQIGKVLLVRLDHIGDVLMTTPAIRALRRALPAAEIHLLVKGTSREAVELNPHLDRVIAFDAPWTIAHGKKAGWREILGTVRGLRRESYDCLIDFRADPREALLAAGSGAARRIGYGERGGGFCFHRLVPFDPLRHEILRALDLLVPLGIADDGYGMDLSVSPEDREEADRLLAGLEPRPGEKLVGIHPGAASRFKRWSPEGFSRLGDLLAEKSFRVILLGAKSDRGLLEAVAGGMKSRPAVAVPGGIRILAALVEKLDCLIGNDSAPAHIAQAVGTRAVVLYGPTHDRVTGPLDRDRHSVIRNPVPCSPCWLPGRKFRCGYDFRCWKGLRAEMIAETVTVFIQ